MISIIVPVYNVERYLQRCISSLVKQTYKEIEIILVDDGSTDASLEICNQWKEKDQRIKVVHQENAGVSSARNLGLNLARGEYLFFVDADDWLDEKSLLEMLEHMKDDVDFVSCDFQCVEEEGCQHKNYVYPECYGKVSGGTCVRDYYEPRLYATTIWGKLFRKELWDDIRFQPLANSEDSYAMFEIIEKIRNAYLMDRKYYYYLQRTSGASRGKTASYYRDILVTLELNYQKAKEKYQSFAEESAEIYIKYAYALVKFYVKEGKRNEAVELIKKMQLMKQESIRKTSKRSIKLLDFPTWIIYMLLNLKVRISQNG